jgi:hypothetical protein
LVQAMNKFEDFPGNIRALMLSKLAMEMAVLGCANIRDLAKKRRSDPLTIWRDICRKSGQPACTIPIEAMQPGPVQNH